MPRRGARLATFLLSYACWQLASLLFQVDEPWDVPGYWIAAYPASLLAAALAGRMAGRPGWLPGVLVTFAQLPVMLLNSGVSPFLPAGVIFLGFLSVPAALASTLGYRHAGRLRPG